MSEHLTFVDYDRAMCSQDACNLSGLVHALSEVMPRISAEARERGEGTEYVNNHPIVRLYVEQLQHLCRTEYHKAYSVVADKIAKR